MFTICYTLLIIVAILFSWVGNIYGLLLPDGEVLPNLLSEESVRWFVRNSMDHISLNRLANTGNPGSRAPHIPNAA